MPKSDTPTLILRKTRDGRLEPATPYDAEVLDGYYPGTLLTCRLTQEKNPKLLGLYWHVLKEVQPNTHYPDSQSLHTALCMETGRWKIWTYHRDGSQTRVPVGISDMSQPEFSAYVTEAFDLIYKEWGIDVEIYRRKYDALMKDDAL